VLEACFSSCTPANHFVKIFGSPAFIFEKGNIISGQEITSLTFSARLTAR
jgi:hypothetical protein